MGGHQGWKAKLKALFPKAWRTKGIENPGDVQQTIEDWSIATYGLLCNVRTGEDIASKVTASFVGTHTQYINIELISVLFDEREYTPISKQKTQKKRKANTEKYTDTKAFTKEEIISNKIRITDDLLPDIERVKMTPILVDDVYRYISDVIKVSTSDVYSKLTIWVQGGRISCIDDELRTIPQEFIRTSKRGADFGLMEQYISIALKEKRIGEVDIKIVQHINQSKYSNIVVKSKDTDTICILLLNMRNWMTMKNGKTEFTKHIYWDDGYDNYLDINCLWLEIVSLFRKQFPSCTYYVETMVILIITCGTDFNNGYHSLGPTRLWAHFEKNGYEQMFCDSPGLFDFKDGTFCFGDCEKRQSFNITESKLRRLLDSYFTKKVNTGSKNKKRDSNGNGKGESKKGEALKNLKEKNNGLLQGKNEVPTMSQMLASIRRSFWTIEYWLNEARPCRALDPLLIDKQSGLPSCGYKLVTKKNDDGEIITSCEYAEKVAIFKN
jgi:hypothetical protein